MLKNIKNRSAIKLVYFLFCYFQTLNFCFAQIPQIQPADIYNSNIKISDYLVSEKLDGIRAHWNGKELISRKGRVFTAPKWFIKDFPDAVLDGELWVERNKFELVSSIVRTEDFNNDKWQKVRFMVFDMPQYKATFAQRLELMEKLISESNSPYLKLIEQYKVKNHKSLMQKLEEVTEKGGEGLMLHKANSFYKLNKSDDLLKLKTFQEDEAIIIAYKKGKGKYKDMLGSILVENKDKVQFYIGGGFDDEQRKNPPLIGALIIYKYFGKTKNNKPRFASFVRVKSDEY